MKKLEETISLSERDKQLLMELKSIVSRHVPGAVMLLYGSAARGDRTAESDYDLLILTQRKLSRAEEDALDTDIYRFQLEKGVVLSAVILPADEWERPVVKVSPYYRNVTRDAIAI